MSCGSCGEVERCGRCIPEIFELAISCAGDVMEYHVLSHRKLPAKKSAELQELVDRCSNSCLPMHFLYFLWFLRPNSVSVTACHTMQVMFCGASSLIIYVQCCRVCNELSRPCKAIAIKRHCSIIRFLADRDG
jgi:hypothetical protein